MKYLALGELFNRGRRPSGPTPRRKRKSHLSRSAWVAPLRLELLEDRVVPSTLPTPTVTGQTDIMDNVNAQQTNPNLPLPFPATNDYGATENRSAPQVVADPLNPNKLVAVWVVDSVALTPPV